MIPVAKNIDLDVLKMPLILVQEYGLNKLRLASMLMLALDQQKNCARSKPTQMSSKLKKESNQWLSFIVISTDKPNMKTATI